jgi:hypothetical protein
MTARRRFPARSVANAILPVGELVGVVLAARGAARAASAITNRVIRLGI